MLYLVLGITYILNLLFGNNKWFKPIMWLLLFVLLAGNYGSYDTTIFYDRYNDFEHFKSFTELGFTCLVSLFHMLGFSVYQFMFVLGLFEITILMRFVNKYCINPTMFWAFFLIFPMLSMFVQLRFLLSLTILLFGFLPELIDKKHGYIWKCIFWCLLASLFHTSAIAFLIYIFIHFFNEKKLWVITILGIVILYSKIAVKLMIYLGSFIVDSRKLTVLLEEAARADGNFGRFVLTLAMSFGMYCLLYCIKKKYLGGGFENPTVSDDLLRVVMKIDILSIIFIPMIQLFSVGFYRIPQCLLILNFIVIANYIDISKKYKITVRSFFLLTSAFLAAICLFVMVYHTREMFELVFWPFFEQNWMIKLLYF